MAMFIISVILAINFVLKNNVVEADVPAIFIFGDSTVDVGTNNFLNDSLARADRAFNGIDFPFSKATGRFSNGYNTADFLVRLMSEDYETSPEPFLSLLQHNSTFKRDLMYGANFASGGSGILDQTGKDVFKDVESLGDQIKQFLTALTNITDILGLAKAGSLVNNSVYLISVGSNDLFDYQRSSFKPPQDIFMANLSDKFADHLKDLYNLGARKFGIVGVPPIGCCPYERFLYGGGVCVEKMNELARVFYTSTEALLRKFSSQSPGVVYSLGDAYQMTMNLILNPLASGFKNVKSPCCGNETAFSYTDLGLCSTSENLCRNRDEYLFWDWYHPTQNASLLAAISLYAAEAPLVTPMNFSRLVLL